jgi:hypothetical protein
MAEEAEVLTLKDKIDLLKHMEMIQRSNVQHRIEREQSVFSWSSNILLVLIGALLIAKPSESAVWSSYGLWGRVVATIAVILLVTFSIQWQNRNRRLQRENGEVIQRIDHLLHYFEKGYFDPNGELTIFPEHWATAYPTKDLGVTKRLRSTTFPAATAILGLLAIAMIWVA